MTPHKGFSVYTNAGTKGSLLVAAPLVRVEIDTTSSRRRESFFFSRFRLSACCAAAPPQQPPRTGEWRKCMTDHPEGVEYMGPYITSHKTGAIHPTASSSGVTCDGLGPRTEERHRSLRLLFLPWDTRDRLILRPPDLGLIRPAIRTSSKTLRPGIHFYLPRNHHHQEVWWEVCPTNICISSAFAL